MSGTDSLDASTVWDPDQYLRFSSQRSRPLVELLSRIRAAAPQDPSEIVDLGCGPGTDTPLIRAFFPEARVLGVDSSAEMIQRAQRCGGGPQISYRHLGVREWVSGEEASGGVHEVVLSNAMFHWLPDQLEIMARILDLLAPGGVFGFQVPGNFEAPSHVLLRELAAEPRFARHLCESLPEGSLSAEQYWGSFSSPGVSIDAWETTYLQVLQGEDPVFEWVRSTAARPVLQALPEPLLSDFAAEYRRRLRSAYPPTAGGTVFPFRRIFVVVTRS